jgi:hypothetical protein
VKSIRFAREFFPNQKKEKPGYQNADGALRQPKKCGKTRPPREGHARELFKTCAAQHAVIVFGDAFPAEELRAFRAASHRLAFGVV